MDRPPGLSVRLKLTLSYAGFLMVAGFLMLAAAWLAGRPGQFFDILRYVPDSVISTLGADDYLTKPFELQELALRLRALDRRRAHNRPPVREIAGLRLDPFRREVYRDGRYVALTRKQFAVLEVLVEADGGVVSAEQLLERAWDQNADPFTNAVRITVSALRKRLGEPGIIATVPGVGYRIDAQSAIGGGGGDRG